MVYNTLLELYLGEIGTCRLEDRSGKELKALELLKRPEVEELCVYVDIAEGNSRMYLSFGN